MTKRPTNIQGWMIDRRISIPTLLQLGAIVIFGVTFYNNSLNNQEKNETRFKEFADQRKTQAEQMIDMQKGQNQMLLQLSTITERQNYLTDAVKDLSLTIKTKGGK